MLDEMFDPRAGRRVPVSTIFGSYRGQHWVGCSCEYCLTMRHKHLVQFHDSTTHRNRCISCQYHYLAFRGVEQGRKEMATSINLCERPGCNAMMTSSSAGTVALASGAPYVEDAEELSNLSLCPACVEDVYTLLTAAPTAVRERAYSEPYLPSKSASTGPLAEATDEEIAAAYLARVAKREAVNELTDGNGE